MKSKWSRKSDKVWNAIVEWLHQQTGMRKFFPAQMREIIQLTVGGAGNRTGEAFWTTIIQEHGIDKDGTSIAESTWNQQYGRSVYFNELSSGKLVPRSVQVDLESRVLDEINGGAYGQLFDPDNQIYSHTRHGSGSNYAVGYCEEGHEISDECLDAIRREVEKCDAFHGFEILNSLCGGTGSGLGMLLTELVRTEYPWNMVTNYCLIPSPSNTSPMEYYNSFLSFRLLIQNCDQAILVDNDALDGLCRTKLRIKNIQWKDLNQLVATAISGVTSSCRFPGSELNTGYQKLAVNLVPRPRLKFGLFGSSPLQPQDQLQRTFSVPEILQEVLQFKNMLAICDYKQPSRYLTAAVFLRGNVSHFEAEDSLRKFRDSTQACWHANWTKYSTCPVSPPSHPLHATLVANTNAVNTIFQRLLTGVEVLYSKRSYVSTLMTAGLEEAEISEALWDIRDVIHEYQYFDDAYQYEEEYHSEIDHYSDMN